MGARAASGRGLWVVLGAAVLAVVLALAVRAYLHASALRAATATAEAALSRDTFGGFRDADRALRDLVGPHSQDLYRVSLRSYALAQLAARYGDDQAAVDSELLNAPLERALQGGQIHDADLPARFWAARALLLLASSEPGSALLMLSGSPPGHESSELSVVRAQVLTQLEKPAAAAAALSESLNRKPPSLEALWAAAATADKAHDDARTFDLAEQAVQQNPNHWPSLLLLGALGLRKAVDPEQAKELLARALPNAATEASPAEQCLALTELAQLDLILGNISAVVATIDRGANIEEISPTCRVDLARIDRRLGRDEQALALLHAAADDEDPGEAALAYAEVVGDPIARLRYAGAPPPPGLTNLEASRYTARVNAVRLQAALQLGKRKEAALLAPKIEGWETPQGFDALAHLKAANGDLKGATRLLEEARRVAAKAPNAGDVLASVGEQALALSMWQQAATACGDGARHAPGNYRALLCQARGLWGQGRTADARIAIDKAVALNPLGEQATALRAQIIPGTALAAPAAAGP